MTYDKARLCLFDTLAVALRGSLVRGYSETELMEPAPRNKAFFEAWLSNLIEGLDYTAAEAMNIVLNGQPGDRPGEAAELRATFELALNPSPLVATEDADLWLSNLCLCHRQLKGAAASGFKTHANQAGDTVFVKPSLVRGTLMEGFALAHSLPSALAKAIYVLFLISEVHPFSDGNGRIARLAMNAQLSQAGQHRIIVPPFLKGECLSSLRQLSRQGDPQPLIATMVRCYDWTASCLFYSFDYALGAICTR